MLLNKIISKPFWAGVLPSFIIAFSWCVWECFIISDIC